MVCSTHVASFNFSGTYYTKLKSRLSVRTFFWWSVSRPRLRGSASDLLDVVAASSGMTKFVFGGF